MKKVISSIRINSTPEKIWQILTEFDRYPEWNPFIKSVQGNVKLGNQINVHLNTMHFKPTVIAFEVNKTFKWKGVLWFKGLFDGEHAFEIQHKGDHCIFLHHEKFSGVLPYFLGKSFFQNLNKDFEAMNEALKIHAEND